jgi:hypothetical protein
MFLKTMEEYSFAVMISANNDVLGIKGNSGTHNLILQTNK